MFECCLLGDKQLAAQFRNLLKKQVKKIKDQHYLKDYLDQTIELIQRQDNALQNLNQPILPVHAVEINHIVKKKKKRGFKGSKVTVEELTSHLSQKKVHEDIFLTKITPVQVTPEC